MKELTEQGFKAIPYKCDVSDENQVQKMIEDIVNDYGKLDCAFNNAGIQTAQKPMAQITYEEFDKTVAVDFKGVWNCMKFEIEQNGQTLVFVKKFVSQDEYNKITHNTHSSRCGRGDTIGNKKLDVTLIGKFIINKWNDKEFPQIEITEIDTEISKGTKRRRL